MDTTENQNNNQLIIPPMNTLINPTVVDNINNADFNNLNQSQIINNPNFNEEKNTGNNGRWEHNEHIRFLGGCLQFGNNWKKVETYVKTRTSTQIRSHAQKYLNKLQKKYYSNNNLYFPNINKIDNPSSTNATETINNTDNSAAGIIEYNNNNNEEKMIDIQENDIKMDRKYKINEAKLKQLLINLNKPDFDIEIVEKIILKIFCFHKKSENFMNSDNINYNKSPTFKKVYGKFEGNKNDLQQGKRNSKNIFFCQKLKREPNYDKQVKDMLNSNEPKDLEKLFYIYQNGNNGKEDPSYKTLMTQLENYD